MMDIIFVVVGLVLLFFGGEGLVRGAVAIATRLKISTLLVRLVIVGFGTSVPELLVSVQAALKGTPDIALGNVVGSNIANIMLILGLSAVFGTVMCGTREIKRDMLAVIAASALLAAFSFTHDLGPLAGIVMLGMLTAYLWWCYHSERKTQAAAVLREHIEEDLSAGEPLLKSVLYTLGGLALLVVGAKLLVDGAVSLATAAGVSQAVIGLTLVAVGTSLPELATAIVSAIRKHSDVVIGNVLGSNLFNVLAILGITGLITPIPFAGRIADIDVWIMLGVAALLAAFVFTMGRLNRATGVAFLAAYVGYSVWLFL
ncbi:MAG: calcium/sodium antiporter [Alphaproteobacteria bacterium]|nr:calcium/sodium antiporter [Alphaproteobacteria bacterium]